MKYTLRQDAQTIVCSAIKAMLPKEMVREALHSMDMPGHIILISVGKAAWHMARAAVDELGERVQTGFVLTKYGHVEGDIWPLTCIEAGHPVPDDNAYKATQQILTLCDNLTSEDTVLFLLSGGGSALFEQPLIPPGELEDITAQLLRSGASITEINTIRKRLSAVKAGKFAHRCSPAQVKTIILSDVLGDKVDMIASGPTVPDPTSSAEAQAVAERYSLRISEEARRLLKIDGPRTLPNAQARVVGSVSKLCSAARSVAQDLGYEAVVLTDSIDCEAREAGRFLASIARMHSKDGRKLAIIAGGETVVHVTGTGQGGRNQELALAASVGIDGLTNVAVISVGSDGTDGPTDAAGGYVDGYSFSRLVALGVDVDNALNNNDAYNALNLVDGLVITGPTGTNVNDVSMILIDRSEHE